MIYFDITNLLAYARHTHNVSGIQRVTVEAMRGLDAEQIPFFLGPLTNKWYCLQGLDCQNIEDLKEFQRFWIVTELCDHLDVSNYRAYAREYLRRDGRFRTPAKLFLLGLQFPVVNFILAAIARTLLKHRLRIKPTTLRATPMPKLGADDTVCLMGAPWDFQRQYKEFFQTLHQGTKRVLLIYDLIPLVCPYVPDAMRDKFKIFIPWALDTATQIIVNSDSCKNDLTAFAARNGQTAPPIVKAQLAHRLPIVIDPAEDDPQGMSLRLRKLIPEIFALCVGSIESRKNHLNLLIQWAKFVRSEHYMNQKLVIAGRWSWDNETTKNFLTETGHIFGSVIVIDSPDDAELQELYRYCRFTVFPSHYEGWGLPVGESLSFGKPCLTFDNSSLKEAGLGLSQNVPANNYRAFYNEFLRLMCDESYHQRAVDAIAANSGNLRSWADFSADIRVILL